MSTPPLATTPRRTRLSGAPPTPPLRATRRTWLSAALSTAVLGLSALALAACAPEGPRALVVADGTGPLHTDAVKDRVQFFQQKTARQVRVLVVPAEQAILLAGRGEADVAVVPMDASLDSFLAREDGKVAGLFTHGSDKMKVLEVDARQHPKVDAKGAKDLASALTLP